MRLNRNRKRKRRVQHRSGNITVDFGDLGEEFERRLSALTSGVKYVPWYRKVRERTEEEERRLELEIKVLTEARDAICGRCAEGNTRHGCPAFVIRRMIADRGDAEEADLSPKDWRPRKNGDGPNE